MKDADLLPQVDSDCKNKKRNLSDSSLYYQEPTYRTAYIMPMFAHNTLIMKEKGLLIIDEKAGNFSITRLGGE